MTQWDDVYCSAFKNKANTNKNNQEQKQNSFSRTQQQISPGICTHHLHHLIDNCDLLTFSITLVSLHSEKGAKLSFGFYYLSSLVLAQNAQKWYLRNRIGTLTSAKKK